MIMSSSSLQTEDCINDSNWLSSSFIDWILKLYAQMYTHVSYLSCDFVPLHMDRMSVETFPEIQYDLTNNDAMEFIDIIGRKVDPQKRDRPLVFFYNRNHIHWNLIRVQFLPTREVQIFEPMGQINRRVCTKQGRETSMHESIKSYRYIPKCIIDFLNRTYPIENGKSWLDYSIHVIRQQQQFSSYDCGIACLLYAMKCGKGEDIKEMNENITQMHITAYRKQLQRLQNEWITPPSSPPMTTLSPTQEVDEEAKKNKKRRSNELRRRVHEERPKRTKRTVMHEIII